MNGLNELSMEFVFPFRKEGGLDTTDPYLHLIRLWPSMPCNFLLLFQNALQVQEDLQQLKTKLLSQTNVGQNKPIDITYLENAIRKTEKTLKVSIYSNRVLSQLFSSNHYA